MAKPRMSDPEPRARGFKTLQDYRDSGALDHKPVPPSYLVRNKEGAQFSTPATEAEAIRQAALIGGSYEWYVPTQAIQATIGETYDH